MCLIPFRLSIGNESRPRGFERGVRSRRRCRGWRRHWRSFLRLGCWSRDSWGQWGRCCCRNRRRCRCWPRRRSRVASSASHQNDGKRDQHDYRWSRYAHQTVHFFFSPFPAGTVHLLSNHLTRNPRTAPAERIGLRTLTSVRHRVNPCYRWPKGRGRLFEVTINHCGWGFWGMSN